MASLYLTNKYLITIVAGQEVSAGARLPYLSDEIPKAESLLSCFESYVEALLEWVRQSSEILSQCHKYVSIYDPLLRRLFEASGSIKSELCRYRLFGRYEND